MESRDRDEEALNGAPQRRGTAADDPRLAERTRLRVIASCLLLIGLAFVQSPGAMIADTKFDLVGDPGAFLARALHLWDPTAAFGQLQNQAYGYLWPMGPFFWLGDAVSLPGWVTQRLWLGLLLCAAFVGVVKVCRELGVRSDLACFAAGFAYAASPRILSTIGPISVEAWPSAIAPWVLLPLVMGADRGSPRRAAALSALAISLIGGVNAAAAFAALPVAAIWLLTRAGGRRRRSMLLWWPIFTLLGTVWWLVPLFVMGAYSPPFLDFIETASVTTLPTTVFDALRGTSDWVPYVDDSWRGGHAVITNGFLALNAGVVLMLGAVGLIVRSNPHRRFLTITLLAGLLLVTMGHQGSVEGWFAGNLSHLLDGSLAPVRNVHKFDPIVRMPMAIGLAFAIQAAMTEGVVHRLAVGRRTLRLSSHWSMTGLALVGVIGAATPLLQGGLAPKDAVISTPGYWQETVDWLDQHGEGRNVALLAPGSGFAQYLWGSPRDEPAQYLAADSWGVRNAIPLAPPGNIRMLDAIEQRLNQGEGSTGLTMFLQRSGVSYLVVRNDLRPTGDVPDPTLVHQALEASPGVDLVEEFGPKLEGGSSLRNDEGRIVVNSGWQVNRRVVEVYRVRSGADAVVADRLPTVLGGPEDLLDLADSGTITSQPTHLAMDADPERQVPGPVVLTDGLVDRERFFGRVHDSSSATWLPGDRRRSGNPTKDYLPSDAERWQTTGRLTGARALTASSSMSDSDNPGGSQPGHQPFAALDADPGSAWMSARLDDQPAWWQIDLEGETSLSSVRITLGSDGVPRSDVRVSTEAGTSETVEISAGKTRSIPLPAGETSWLRVEQVGSVVGQLALAEVDWDGRDVARELVLPKVPTAWGAPDAILLRGQSDWRTGCAIVGNRIPCVGNRAVPPEEPADVRRIVDTPRDASYEAEIWARPRPGNKLYAFLQEDLPLNASGSSVAVRDPRGSALAAVDGDPGTAWTPRLDDPAPTLALNWLGQRRVRSFRITVDDAMPVRRPTSVLVEVGNRQETVKLDRQGRGRLKRAVRTSQLTIRVADTENTTSVEPDGSTSFLPPGIGEVTINGLSTLPQILSDRVGRQSCGTGPALRLNGVLQRTALVASPQQLFEGASVPAVPCGPGSTSDVGLRAGENDITVEASDVSTLNRLVLTRGETTVAPATPVAVDNLSPVARRAAHQGDGRVLVLRQNHNPGWVASQDGEALDPVVVDGWQQGFELDPEGGPVEMSFAPDSAYRLGLVLGGFALLVLLGLVVWSRNWTDNAPPLSPGRVPVPVLLGLALVGGGLLGGNPGALVAVAGVVLSAAFGPGTASTRGRGTGEWWDWTLGLTLFVAAGAYFWRPWASPNGWAGDWSWPHYLVIFVVASLLTLAADLRPRFVWSPQSLSRIAGTSTKR